MGFIAIVLFITLILIYLMSDGMKRKRVKETFIRVDAKIVGSLKANVDRIDIETGAEWTERLAEKFLVLEFPLEDGRIFSAKSPRVMKVNFKIGDGITIYYNPEDPRDFYPAN